MAAPSVFEALSAGRSHFRIQDLLQLVVLIARQREVQPLQEARRSRKASSKARQRLKGRRRTILNRSGRNSVFGPRGKNTLGYDIAQTALSELDSRRQEQHFFAGQHAPKPPIEGDEATALHLHCRSDPSIGNVISG